MKPGHTFGHLLRAQQITYMLDLIYNADALGKQMTEKGHRFIVVQKDKKPVGFSSYEIDHAGLPQLMIHKIYLLPITQGMGIGTLLLNLLADTAQQYHNKRLRLKVYFENKKAIDFYKKYGFKKIKTEITNIGNNYSITDDIMIKELK